MEIQSSKDYRHKMELKKGVKTILLERGLWKSSLNLQSARELLSMQEDFKAEREWLEQIVTNAGCEILWFPKFHCELNPIELVSGFIKGYFRRNCTFSYKDLSEQVEPFMKQIPLQYIASYYGHCEKFMEGYKQGLTGYLLDFAIKRYASHRPFPTNLTKNLSLKNKGIQ